MARCQACFYPILNHPAPHPVAAEENDASIFGIPVFVIFRILLCLPELGFYRGGWDDYRLWPKTEIGKGENYPKLVLPEMGKTCFDRIYMINILSLPACASTQTDLP